jgi:hypothetical protein
MKTLNGMFETIIEGDTDLSFPEAAEIEPFIDGEEIGCFTHLGFGYQNSLNARGILYVRIDDLERLIAKVKKREAKFKKREDKYTYLEG